MRPCRRRKSYFPSSEIAGLELGEEAKIRHRQRAKSVWSLVHSVRIKEARREMQAAASYRRSSSAWREAEERLFFRRSGTGQST